MAYKESAIKTRMKKEFEQLSAKFAQAYKDVPTNIAEIEINEAIRVVRKRSNKKSK
jgi:hypothetical protein